MTTTKTKKGKSSKKATETKKGKSSKKATKKTVKKSKRGRPSLGDKAKRTTFTMKVHHTQLVALHKTADKEGLSLAAFILKKCLPVNKK